MHAGSLLESVVALTIISICLFIAVIIYSAVFASRTSIMHYNNTDEINNAFYIMQLDHDSLSEAYSSNKWEVEEENIHGLKKVTVRYRDSVNDVLERTYYIKTGK
jgi:type II secretory pathway component PulJ